MNGLSVKSLLPPDCFKASIDLKDAIPIESCQKFLRLAEKTAEETFHLQVRALPLGLSSSHLIFTKVMVKVQVFL